MRILLGPAAQPLDVGRATRVVPTAMRRALNLRDGGCVFPGCDRTASWCDAHHKVPWIDGGATSLDNLVLLCRAHHRMIHDNGWTLPIDRNGHRGVGNSGPGNGRRAGPSNTAAPGRPHSPGDDDPP